MPNMSPTPSNTFDTYRFSEDANYSSLYTNLSTDNHTHKDFYEFSLITYGEFDNVYHGKHYILEKNALIFFKPGESHAIYSKKPDSIHFSFVITKELFESLFRQFFPENSLKTLSSYVERHLFPVQGEYLTHLANQLMDNSNRDLRNYWMRLFLFNALSACIIPEHHAPALKSTAQYVEDLLTRFNNLTYLKHKVHEIYKDYPITKSTLISEFRKRTGYTIVQYHTMKKLDYAAQLLASSQPISVTDVCTSLNFTSLSHFSKIFKEHFQISPKEYQRLHARYQVSDENYIGLD